MYVYKTKKYDDCPIEFGMSMIGGKWRAKILCILSKNGRVRYKDIKKLLPNVTDTILASVLKDMVANNMILRFQYDELPPRVEYALSDAGRAAIPILMRVYSWTKLYFDGQSEKCRGRYCDYMTSSRTKKAPPGSV